MKDAKDKNMPLSELFASIVLPSQKAVWLNADMQGWHNPTCDLQTALLLIHSEVSQACESLCIGDTIGVESELADVIIRVLHTAQKYGFDMEKTVWKRHRESIASSYWHSDKKS